MSLREAISYFRQSCRASRIPFVSDLALASWANWREAIKEIFVTLFFSLMPLWVGVIMVTILTIAEGTSAFISKFASTSDLGILSASLLGPLLYMMFREEDDSTGTRGAVPRFPSGLWFIMIIVACCIIATVIYSFTYLSGVHAFYDKGGKPVSFLDRSTVAVVSWILFSVVVLIILFACTIRNAFENEPPSIMRAGTQDYVDEFRAAQGGSPAAEDTEEFVSAFGAAAQEEHK